MVVFHQYSEYLHVFIYINIGGKMKIKNKAVIIGVLLFALLLAACGSVPAQPESEQLSLQNSPADVVDAQSADISESAETFDESLTAHDAKPHTTIPDSISDALSGEFTVYFLDVGQGAAAFIICDEKTMLIDGGGAASSSLIYSFLERHGVDHLDYIINTHPHEDHVGGLSGALNFVSSVGTVFGSSTQYDTRVFEGYVRHLGNHDAQIIIPEAGDSFMLGSALVQIKGPVREYDDVNNNSIVLKVTYGETSFMFKGDAERSSEIDMLEAGYDLSATVLKVSHHGSDTSTTYPFLREVMPDIAIISCGAGNSYGHPHENTLSRLRDADVTVYRTDLQGDIIITSDGKSVSVRTERNSDIPTNPTERADDEEHYIGNASSMKLHRPGCRTLPAEHNRVIFRTLQEAFDAGHDACGNCKPF